MEAVPASGMMLSETKNWHPGKSRTQTLAAQPDELRSIGELAPSPDERAGDVKRGCEEVDPQEIVALEEPPEKMPKLPNDGARS